MKGATLSKQLTDVSLLEGQLLIYSGAQVELAGATHFELGSLRVASIGDVGLTMVYGRQGALIGCFIGTVIDTDGCSVLSERTIWDLDYGSSEELDAAIEAYVYKFAGSFLFILDFGSNR